MPFTLPAMSGPGEGAASGGGSSRRAFLTSSALAAGGWATGTAAEAASERWALLSDTHLAADAGTVSRQGVNMAEHFRRVIAEVVAEAESLDGVIVDGDCAYDDGQRGDYDTFARLLQPVREAGLPVHVTLGNHDDRGPFFEAFAEMRPEAPPVEGRHVGVADGRAVTWVFLDSLRYVNRVEGEFGAAQLAWLEGFLARRAASDRPVVLVGHHYPQVTREDVIPGEKKIPIAGLVDSEAFLGVVSRFPAAKAYVYGHSHDWKVTAGAGGFHLVNLPPTAYVFNPARPSGWVRATVDGAGMTLELRALDVAHPEHGRATRLEWR
jgi:3',5'-cyclic AMP phosphodiesterase CpdA